MREIISRLKNFCMGSLRFLGVGSRRHGFSRSSPSRKTDPLPLIEVKAEDSLTEEGESMFPEIRFLKDNLKTSSRGDAVAKVQSAIGSLLDRSDWISAETFFHEFQEVFQENASDLGIVKNAFVAFSERLLDLPESFEVITILNRLQYFSWFDSLGEVNRKKGYIAENMARFSQGGEIFELQKARLFYRKAHLPKEVERIQAILSEKVRSFKHFAPMPLPEGFCNSTQEEIRKILEEWGRQTNEVRWISLVIDHYGIRPSPPRDMSPSRDIFPSGLLHDLGVIQGFGVSSDGRTNSGTMAKPFERDEDSSWEFCFRLFLSAFVAEFSKWLTSQDEGQPVHGKLISSLRTQLSWDDNSIQHFNAGLAGWLNGFPEIALSFWLPYFESALRLRLADLGEDIISPKEKPGIEDFVGFDGLLNRAGNHYEERTVRYWRKIFSTEQGLGWNLRNDFCHGLLPMKTMKEYEYSFAVLIAYLFLLQPILGADKKPC